MPYVSDWLVLVIGVVVAIGVWLTRSKGSQPGKQIASVGQTIAQSLQPLGLQLSARHVIGFIVAMVSGMVVARLLPLVWVYLDPILTLLVGSGSTTLRNKTNEVAMMVVSGFTSFYIAYRTFKKP
jgi:hypothetical protein